MNFRNIIRVIGLLVLLFSFISILPILISFIYKDNSESAFLKTFLYSFIIGIFFWIPNKKQKGRLNSREGFLVVVLFWTVLGSLGSLPFLLIKFPYFSVTDAFFESFSGLTTTGATVLLNLEKLPMGILFYRQMLQWFGGMGIIVLAVAILPIEGTKLYYAEIPGPIKDNKICPRISQIAKNLWIIYISLTILCIFLLWIAGMSFFDSVAHSFSIVSIGGFSTKNNSIGHYNSPLINTIVAVFLIISSCNYNLHFSAVHYHSLKVYWKDQEFKVFIGIQIFLFVFCASILYLYKIYDSFLEILNKSFFQVISMSTTAGFITDRSYLWPSVLPILLLCSAFIGGCSGSTAGGIKVIRILLFYLQGIRELKKLIHPNAVYIIKVGNKYFSSAFLETVWGYFSAYIFVFISSMLAIISTGIENFSAFTAVTATLNNLGPGLGIFSENFSSINNTAKWILVLNMLFGRLEIFTLLVIFTPTFWKE